MNSNPERKLIMDTTNSAATPATTSTTLSADAAAAVASAPEGTATITITEAAAPAPAPAAAPAPAPKVVKHVIYKDAAGNELKRTVLGRGRPPRNSTVDADGNRVVVGATLVNGEIELPTQKVERAEIFYITVDDNGGETKREPKGRGRPRPGYVKHEKGAFAGHWVGRPVVKATPAAAPAAPAADETAPAAAESENQMEGAEDVTGATPHLTNA